MAHKIPYEPSPKGPYPIPELEPIREYEIGFGSDSLHMPSPHWYAKFWVPGEKAFALLGPLINIWNQNRWPLKSEIENDRGEATFYWPVEDLWAEEAQVIPKEEWHKLKSHPQKRAAVIRKR